MLNVFVSIISFLGLISFIFVILFVNKEGNDERGDKILGRAGMVGFLSFLLGYNLIFLANILLELTSMQYTFSLACLLALVLLSYSSSIFILRKKY